MAWTVTFSPKAAKQKAKLPARISERLDALRTKIEAGGPLQPRTPHFGYSSDGRVKRTTAISIKDGLHMWSSGKLRKTLCKWWR